MSDDVIFMKEGNDLVPLSVADYQAEAVLQELLERHSQLLAGAQMTAMTHGAFLLVAREAPVADREGGAGRWSILLGQRAFWAGEHSLPTVNAPGSFQVGQAKTRGGQGALVRVYPTFRTIEMPLVSLWEGGRESEIPDIVSRIQLISHGDLHHTYRVEGGRLAETWVVYHAWGTAWPDGSDPLER
jgi:hypothetical protein